MDSKILFLGLIVYFGFSLFLGPKIYFWFLGCFGSKKLKDIGLELDDVEFSFEQIDYLVATPSVSYKFTALDSIQIEKVSEGIFSPQLHALQINVQLPTGGEKNLALITKENFSVPILETLLYYDQINEWEYKLLISYLFSHDYTKKLIMQEVKKRVTEGRAMTNEINN